MLACETKRIEQWDRTSHVIAYNIAVMTGKQIAPVVFNPLRSTDGILPKSMLDDPGAMYERLKHGTDTQPG